MRPAQGETSRTWTTDDLLLVLLAGATMVAGVGVLLFT
ncbi:MAG: hypothetical protein ACI8PZ_000045 [Myxococcota bacterium]|jgi:hypothetical protein